MQNVLKLLKLQVTSDAGSSGGADKKGAGDVARKPNMQRCVTILKALFALESHIDRIPVSPSSDGVKLTGGAKCAVLPGKWLFDVLEKVGFNLLSVTIVCLYLDIFSCGVIYFNSTLLFIVHRHLT